MKRQLTALGMAMALSTGANAACGPLALNGNWAITSMGNDGTVSMCKSNNGNGILTSNQCFIVGTTITFGMNGTFFVDPSCAVGAQFTANGRNVDAVLQLAKNKQIATGVWTDSAGVSGVVNMVKY